MAFVHHESLGGVLSELIQATRRRRDDRQQQRQVRDRLPRRRHVSPARPRSEDWARVEAALAAGEGTVDIEHDERRIWLRADDVAYVVRVVPRRRGAGFSS